MSPEGRQAAPEGRRCPRRPAAARPPRLPAPSKAAAALALLPLLLAALPAAQADAGLIQETYSLGAVTSLPLPIGGASPAATAIVPGINCPAAAACFSAQQQAVFSGWVSVPAATATATFYLASHGGASLEIDGMVFVENAGERLVGGGRCASATLVRFCGSQHSGGGWSAQHSPGFSFYCCRRDRLDRRLRHRQLLGGLAPAAGGVLCHVSSRR